uniref:amphiphysin-like n=1 Tax=Myxine glutinosa TaxID=7769 RepID=UPI00358FBE4F
MSEPLRAGHAAGLLARNVQKRLSRAQEKVLQRLGKADETKDDLFLELVQRFNQQQLEGSRLCRDLRAYLAAIKVLQEAGARLNQDLIELYDTSWPGQEELNTNVEMSSLLWDDYHEKLEGQALISLENYLAQFPDIKARIAKRSRKLVDYDGARHHMAGLQQAKKQDEAKLTKADEEFQKVQKVFEEINSELQEELPILWNSRVGMYVNMFQNLACIEDNFHKEIGKLSHDLFELMSQLAEHHIENTSSLSSPTRKAPPRPVTSPWSPSADSSSNIEFEESRTLSSSSLSSNEPMDNSSIPEEDTKTSSQVSPCYATLGEEENGPEGIPRSQVAVTVAEGGGETTAALMGTKMPSPVHSPTKPVPSALASPTNKQPTARPRQALECEQMTKNAFESPSPEFKPEPSSKVPLPSSPLPESADFPSLTDCTQCENDEVNSTRMAEMIVHPGFGQETAEDIASRHTSNICSDLLTSPGPRNNNGTTAYTDLPSSAMQGVSGLVTEQGTSGHSTEQGTSSPSTKQGASSPCTVQGASGPGTEQGTSGSSTEQEASGPGTERGASSLCTKQGASSPCTKQGASSPSTKQGASSPCTVQGASGPGTEQGTSGSSAEQGASGPGTERGASSLCTKQGASSPCTKQGASSPSTKQGASSPCTVQGASGPGTEQGTSGSSAEQGASGPGTERGASSLCTKQGASSPCTKQGASSPSTKQGASSPCTVQGASGPGTEQGTSGSSAEQGASGPGTERGASSLCTKQGASSPCTKQGASGPSTKQGASSPCTKQGASGPGTERGASGPGTEQGASGHSAEPPSGPGAEQGASGPSAEHGASVPKLLERQNPAQEAKEKDLTATTIENADLPPGFLYKVIAEHEYSATDSDELTLREGDVILVVAPHSPEEQDDGWLTGVKNADWQKHGTTQGFAGVFPENFTERLL